MKSGTAPVRCVLLTTEIGLTGSVDGTARLWDMDSGQLLYTYESSFPPASVPGTLSQVQPVIVTALAVDPTRNTVILGYSNGAINILSRNGEVVC